MFLASSCLLLPVLCMLQLASSVLKFLLQHLCNGAGFGWMVVENYLIMDEKAAGMKTR
uniref:Uncharacterized protein n=1 Tax=Arundo donax TaxID=35708 RepID=A0A0A8ZK23_ARUDO